MFDLDRWKEIWETIARNRKRSIMTGLGVFWGIFMFTVMMGFGMWLGRTALSSLGSYSTNTTYFSPTRRAFPIRVCLRADGGTSTCTTWKPSGSRFPTSSMRQP